MNTRKIITIVLLLLLNQFVFAQVAINTDGSNADASALLDVKSTTKGFLPPRMTEAQRDLIVNPVEGLVVYCTDCKQLQIYDGFAWKDMLGGTPAVGTPTVTNPTTGKIWMDRNLGASQVATSSSDYYAYGSLFQWGRLADGHELVNYTSSTLGTATNGNTTSLSTTDIPGHSLFITTNSAPNDWKSPQNNVLWQGVSGTNNPCPSGFRLATESEWSDEYATWTSADAAGAYNSVLKLTIGGYHFIDGTMGGAGSYGYYWTMSANSSDSKFVTFSANSLGIYSLGRGMGMNVRCIKD